MGCDIHAVIEFRESTGSWWPAAGAVLNVRNYGLFEAMAGVRGEESLAVAAPRGLPRDWCKWSSVAHCLYDGGHSASWLTRAEFEVAVARAYDGHAPPVDVECCLLIMRHYEAAGHDTRIIFNFDN